MFELNPYCAPPPFLPVNVWSARKINEGRSLVRYRYCDMANQGSLKLVKRVTNGIGLCANVIFKTLCNPPLIALEENNTNIWGHGYHYDA